jgi:hypothetical protein
MYRAAFDNAGLDRDRSETFLFHQILKHSISKLQRLIAGMHSFA